MVTIQIPTALRRFTDGEALIEVAAATVGQAVRGLVETSPELRPHLLSEEGALRPFVRLFLDTEDVTTADSTTPVEPTQRLRIVPAIAGG